MRNAYVDVRGPWPSLVRGQVMTSLIGCDRSITVEQAEKVLDLTEREEVISTDLDLPIATE